MTQPNTSGRRRLNRPEAAQYMGISLRMLDALVAGRQVPVIRIGRRVLLDTADLDAALDAAKTGGLAV